jgi:hypothetical protein
MYASPGAGVADELRMSNSSTQSDVAVLGMITKGRVRGRVGPELWVSVDVAECDV